MPKGGQPGNKNAQKHTEEDALRAGNGLLEWISQKNDNIFLEEYFYIQNNYPCDFVKNMKKRFPSFAELIKKALDIQKFKLQKFALSGKANPTMSIFLLKCNHGMNENNKLEISGDGGGIPSEIKVSFV